MKTEVTFSKTELQCMKIAVEALHNRMKGSNYSYALHNITFKIQTALTELEGGNG
jgi:hypothetical protein